MILPTWTRTRASNDRASSPHEALPLNIFQASGRLGDRPAKAGTTSPPWRPMYLTPASLGVFSTIFLACIASVQTMLTISNRHTGLSGDNDALHRVLWSYGPVAILTLISSFWARLEMQTKTTASWFSMAQGNTIASQSLLLDYTSQLQPTAIVSALRHKNYAVAGATMVSLFFKVLLVLATSLITLSPATTVRHRSVPLRLTSEFVDNPAGLTANGPLAAANFASIVRYNTSLPRGVSDKYAYQLIESDFLNTPSTLNTTVDGFFGNIDCQPANLSSSGLSWNLSDTVSGRGYLRDDPIPMLAGSCTLQVRLSQVLNGMEGIRDGDHVVGLHRGGCNGSDSKDDQRLAIIVAVLASSREDIFTIARSNSLICTPTYQILSLDLSARGPVTLLRLSSGQDSRILRNVHPWDMMMNNDGMATLPDASTRIHKGAVTISNQTVWFGGFGYLAYEFAKKSGNPPTMSTISDGPVGLTEFFSHYWQQHSALLAHSSLMRSASVSSKGSADQVTDRFLGMTIRLRLPW